MIKSYRHTDRLFHKQRPKLENFLFPVEFSITIVKKVVGRKLLAFKRGLIWFLKRQSQ